MTTSWLPWLRSLVLVAWGLTGLAFAQDALVAVPPLTAPVTNLTATLGADQLASLNDQLLAFEARKGSQVAVLIVPTTNPESIEKYAIRVAEQRKLGRENVGDGAILVVAKDDREVRIEVGYGLEGVLNDATSNHIIDEVTVPRFRQGDFNGGVVAGRGRWRVRDMVTMDLARTLRHLLATQRSAKRLFANSGLAAIDRALVESKALHGHEIRFAAEAALHPAHLWRNVGPRECTTELFSYLRIWDTEHRNEVLIYVLLADRAVEIVADRAAHLRIGPAGWQAVTEAMGAHFAAGRFKEGGVDALTVASRELSKNTSTTR